jgi:cytoskeletal protein CcmA (bactofilin family)
MTKTSLKLMLPLIFLALLLPLAAAKAFAVKTGSAVTVAQSETIDGNLYAAGSVLVINGEVKGDLLCAGQAVTINGKVDGDVLCAAQAINITGDVAGSVRVAGNDLRLNGKVGRNVMAFGNTVVLGPTSEVGLDMLVGVSYADINGKIDGSLNGAAGVMNINGQIAKDVALTLDGKHNRAGQNADLLITDKAQIGGNLDYTSEVAASIANSNAIVGHISRQLPSSNFNFNPQLFIGLTTLWLWCKIMGLFGLMLIGLVFILLFKNKLLALLDEMVVKPKLKIGWGALVLFVTPMVLIFLMMTLVGLPLAGLLFLIWLVAMIMARVVVGLFAGLLIMGRYRHKRAKNGAAKESVGNMIMAMIVGILITCALFIIPIFGWLVALIAEMWGLGALWLWAKKCCRG